MNFKYHYFAPAPLNIKGAYDSAVKSEVMVSANPCFEVQSTDIPVGVPVPKVSPQREVSSSEQVSPTATMLKIEAAGAGNGMEHAAQSSEESEDREQRYWKYRKLMQKWKDEEKQRLEDIKNAPFQIAQGDCHSYVPDSIYSLIVYWPQACQSTADSCCATSCSNEIRFFFVAILSLSLLQHSLSSVITTFAVAITVAVAIAVAVAV